ncbi:hypothetical protein V6260_04875 [Pseudoalteromonas aliena]|uniref:hypothetical protein n=1 Tax=Pseudoalteromonas aliena TaxID=247523 RepID=UPI00311F74B3
MDYQNNFLSRSQQAALQHAMINTKLLNGTSNTNNIPTSEQQAYGDIAVVLYRFNLQKIKWPSFLKKAINSATNTCQWLTTELTRCQQEYKAQPNDAIIIEQSAFFNGIFSEELTYINALLGTDTQT